MRPKNFPVRSLSLCGENSESLNREVDLGTFLTGHVPDGESLTEFRVGIEPFVSMHRESGQFECQSEKNHCEESVARNRPDDGLP